MRSRYVLTIVLVASNSRAHNNCVSVTCKQDLHHYNGLCSQGHQKHCLREQTPETATSKYIIRRLFDSPRPIISPQCDPQTIPAADPDPCHPSLRRTRPAPTNTHSRPTTAISHSWARQTSTAISCADHCSTGSDACVGVSWRRFARTVVGRFATPLDTRRDLRSP